MKLTIAASMLLVFAGAFFVSTLPANDDGKRSTNQPPELGQVKWNRDLAAAKKASAETKRPVFLLFQEVPG